MSEIARQINDLDLINHGTVELRAGEVSDFFVDMKRGFGNPELLAMAAAEIIKQLPENVTCVAGPGVGGIPLAAAIALQSGLSACYVRGDEKDHGLRGVIEGYKPTDGDVTAIVDDIFTSGSSVRETIEALSQTKTEISSCHVVVKRGDGELPVPLHYLLDIDELWN